MQTQESAGFTTQDGVWLDVRIIRPPHSVATLVIWPCMGGVTAMLQVPVATLLALGFSLIFYHPRGHGRSEGAMGLTAAVADLVALVQAQVPTQHALFLLGHSAGAQGCLRFAAQQRPVQRLFLLAPVLDTRASILALYEHGSSHELAQALSPYSTATTALSALLADPDWLDPSIWQERGDRQRLNASSRRFAVGDFMQDMFVQGHRADTALRTVAARVSVMLAVRDTWQPATTLPLLQEAEVHAFSLLSAGDHFFQGAWGDVWALLLSALKNDPGAA